MYKKLLALILTLTLVASLALTLAACGGGSGTPDTSTSTPKVTATPEPTPEPFNPDKELETYLYLYWGVGGADAWKLSHSQEDYNYSSHTVTSTTYNKYTHYEGGDEVTFSGKLTIQNKYGDTRRLNYDLTLVFNVGLGYFVKKSVNVFS